MLGTPPTGAIARIIAGSVRKAIGPIPPSPGSVIVHDDDGNLCDGAQSCASRRVLDDNVE